MAFGSRNNTCQTSIHWTGKYLRVAPKSILGRPKSPSLPRRHTSELILQDTKEACSPRFAVPSLVTMVTMFASYSRRCTMRDVMDHRGYDGELKRESFRVVAQARSLVVEPPDPVSPSMVFLAAEASNTGSPGGASWYGAMN